MFFNRITELTPDDLIAVKDNRKGNSGDDRWIAAEHLAAAMQQIGVGGLAGTGSPEGIVTARPGVTYFQLDGRKLWVKETGLGNTGWYELLG